MKLISVRFKNFRNFYGDQEVSFSVDDEKNLTVIYAENGFGKTTFLNALNWTFFGTFTAGFERQDDLINRQAAKEGTKSASVDVTFEFLDNTYKATRFVEQRQGNQQTVFKIWKVSGGDQREVPIPESFVETVIPTEMAQYFFFDGEHAAKLVAEGNNAKIAQAIRDILGCGVAENAIEDLIELEKKYNRDLKKQTGDSEVIHKTQEIEDKKQKFEENKIGIQQLEHQITLAQDYIHEKESLLRAHEKTAELQRKIDRLKTQQSSQQEKLSKSQVKFINWINHHSTSVVSQKLLTKVAGILEGQRKVAKFPSRYTEAFVKELLSEAMCVCGRELEKGSEHEACVVRLLEDGADNEQVDRLSRINARIGELTNDKANAKRILIDGVQNQETIAENIDDIDVQLSELNRELGRIPVGEITSLNEELKTARTSLRQLIENAGELKRQNGLIEGEIPQIEKEIDTLMKRIEVGRKSQLLHEVTGKAINKIRNELITYQKSARGVISAAVNKFLERTAPERITFRLDDKFNIKIVFHDDDDLGRSTGQNQIISLVFTAALVEFSKKRAGASGGLWLPGTVAPLFLDSPFGQLNNHFSKSVAAALPKMSDQIVMLLTDKQGDKGVRDSIEPFVGRSYIIEKHVTNTGGPDSPTEDIEVNGRNHVRVFYGQEKNKSVIRAV